MALAKAWELDFNAGSTSTKRALVAKFYSTPDAFNGDPSHLRLDSDGNGSFMTSTFGVPEDGALSFQSDTLMQASAPANGTIAYCYDEDPAKHGRFVRASGSWGSRTGPVRGAHWDDPNHFIRGHLALWVQTWSADAGGDVSSEALRGFPSTPDWRGGELRLRMRLREFRKPETARLVQHYQNRVPSREHWGDALKQAWVNMIQIADPYDTQLDFGGNGFFDRSPVGAVYNTSFQDVVIRTPASDQSWMQLGGQPGRQGMPGDSESLYRYIACKADEALADWVGNCMVVGFYPSIDPATRAVAVPLADRMNGHVDIQKIEMWLPE